MSRWRRAALAVLVVCGLFAYGNIYGIWGELAPGDVDSSIFASNTAEADSAADGGTPKRRRPRWFVVELGQSIMEMMRPTPSPSTAPPPLEVAPSSTARPALPTTSETAATTTAQTSGGAVDATPPADTTPPADATAPVAEFAAPPGGVTVAVIIPFRDRETHLVKFKQFWRRFVRGGSFEEAPPPRNASDKAPRVAKWEIVVAEQFDTEPFNRGWTFNVGLALITGQTSASPEIKADMKVPITCAAVQDIDYLPEPGVEYEYCEAPTQLSSEIDLYDWKVPYIHSAGGIVVMSPQHWQQINGFSNEYFGWGGEDDDLYHRLRRNYLLKGDCYPFCKERDPLQGRPGSSIRRPPKGKGRFSGRYMHSANHTRRVTDPGAYERNVKYLQQMIHGGNQWKSDGLSNLAFRIVSLEVDTTDTQEYGITYHHVRARRGETNYDFEGTKLAVPHAFCGGTDGKAAATTPLGWSVAPLGDRRLGPLPWDNDLLRERTRRMLAEAGVQCQPWERWAASSFILVDRRSHLAKVTGDLKVGLLIWFYRSLANPPEDGLIIADPRTPAEVRDAFTRAGDFIWPAVELRACVAPLGSDKKYSFRHGHSCSAGWANLGGGSLWASPTRMEGLLEVHLCETRKGWMQHFTEGGPCQAEWGKLEWYDSDILWVPPGSQFCLADRLPAMAGMPSIEQYSSITIGAKCAGSHWRQMLTIGSVSNGHAFGSFFLCLSRLQPTNVSTKLDATHSCSGSDWQQVLRLRVLKPSVARPSDSTFCVQARKDDPDKGDEMLLDGQCSKAKLRFSISPVAGTSTASQPRSIQVCAGPGPSGGRLVGFGEECGNQVKPEVSFQAFPAGEDIAASTPPWTKAPGGSAERPGRPLYSLVHETVVCGNFFCREVLRCADRNDPGDQPCSLTA